MPPAPPPIMPMPPAPPTDAIASPASGTGPMAPDWARSMLTQASPPPPPAPMAPPKQAPLTPQTVDRDRLAAQNAQLAAIDQGVESKSQVAQKQGAGEMAAEEEFKRQSELNAKIDATAKASTDADYAAYQAHRKEIANTKINPDDRTAMQRIQGAIAIGLGGFAAAAANRGAGGGTNMALQIIQAKIAKSVEAQMENLKTKKEDVAAEGAQIHENRAQNRVDSMDRLARAQAMRDGTLREIDAQVKMLGTATAQAEGAKLKAGVMAEGAKDEQQTLAQQQTLRMQQAQLAETRRHSLVTEGLQHGEFVQKNMESAIELPLKSAEAQAKIRALDAKNHGIDPERAVGNIGKPELGPDGQPTGRMTASTAAAPIGGKDQIGKVNEKIAEITPVLQALDANLKDAQKLSTIQKLGAAVAGEGTSDVIQRMNARKVQLLQLEHMLAGRVTDTGLAELKQAAGDPTAFMSRAAKMVEFREMIRGMGQSSLGGVGLYDHWEPPSRDESTDEKAAKLGGKTGGTISDTAPSGRAAPRGLPPEPVASPVPGVPGSDIPLQRQPYQFPPPEWLR